MANAFRELKIIRNFDSVRAGGMATVKLPLGQRIHRLDIVYADGTNVMSVANVDGIFGQHRLKIGAKEIRRWTPKDLRIVNQTRGLPQFWGGVADNKSATYPMFFSNPTTRTSLGEDSTALAAYPSAPFNVNDLTLEIDINPVNNANQAAIEPKLYARIEYDYVVPSVKVPYFMFWRSGSFPIAGATQGVYNTIVKPAYYSRIHLKTSATQKIEVKKDSSTIFQWDSRPEYESDMSFKGQSVVAGVWSIIGDGTNRVGDIINLEAVNTFEIYATTNAADDIGILYEEMRAL